MFCPVICDTMCMLSPFKFKSSSSHNSLSSSNSGAFCVVNFIRQEYGSSRSYGVRSGILSYRTSLLPTSNKQNVTRVFGFDLQLSCGL